MTCRNRHTDQPRCDDCGAYGEWYDDYQMDLCPACFAMRDDMFVPDPVEYAKGPAKWKHQAVVVDSDGRMKIINHGDNDASS